MQKKVIFLITKDDIGGAQKYVRDLVDHVDTARFHAKIVTGGPDGVSFLSNAFRPYLLFLNDWIAVGQIIALLRREQPDVLHLNSSKAGVVGAFATRIHNFFSQKKTRVIFTAHGWVFNPDNELNTLRRWFYTALHKLAARFQDVVINVSEYDRALAELHHIAPSEKLVTIHNGIDLTGLKFIDRTSARKALQKLSPRHFTVSSDDLWIGSIGRLVIEKHFEMFIDAAQRIEHPHVKFFIIGDGPDRAMLEKRITTAGLVDRFFIIPRLSPAAPYLRAFDMFVLSSIKEGLPYTLLEAMAAGLPIVGTRVGGIPEILSDNGIVILPRAPHELTRAIDTLLADPEKGKRLAENARRFAQSHLNLERMVRETEAIY